MKKYFAIVLAAVAAIACQKEINEPQVKGVFTASVESYDETKTFTDETLQVKWSEGDLLNVWNAKATSDKYTITSASVGQNTAELELVQAGQSTTETLSANVGYYPYADNITCTADGAGYKLTNITLPATQTYVANSFANGAFPMVAVTTGKDDRSFAFKNVCGVLRIVLSGDMLVKTISVTGNNNEVLCGNAEVSAGNTAMPTITMTGDGKTVTLDCGEGIQLNDSDKKSFDIVLPPIVFEKGFSIRVNGEQHFKTDKQQTITRSRILCMGNKTVVSNNYLKLTSEGGSTIALSKVGSPDAITLLYFKASEGEWKTYTIGDDIALADGESVSFKAGKGDNATLSKSKSDYYKFKMSGTGKVKASGNIMSLLDASCESVTCPEYCFNMLFNNCSILTTSPCLPATTLAQYCYFNMFSGCEKLAFAPELPATTLASYCYSYMFSCCTDLASAPDFPATILVDHCYQDMFYGCTGLTSTPKLYATTLANFCCQEMFYRCTGLTSASELPATILAKGCYDDMFSGCTGLTDAPALPATELVELCYEDMFNGCTGLTSVPQLPALTLAPGCYYEMFRGCTSLAIVPALPATTLARGCYLGMFRGCTSLTSAPKLSNLTLADNCYLEMFYGCTGLTTAPELPATALSSQCYSNMFSGCTSLTSAPTLPAAILAIDCYRGMFNGCSKLNYIKMLATDISATECLKDWTSGVAATGTFVKNAAATWDVRGTSGIPEGWDVKTETPATDLSEVGTANCYIVSSEGTYKFKTVQGNTDISVGTVASASVLWESFGTATAPNVGDLVSDATYADGYITFKASDKKGNALIAAKDANGKILWSWHIWMTDKPEDQVYNNNAGSMMDRNLGATSATPGNVHSLGLLYQWGRKDPFLGSSSIKTTIKAKSATKNISWSAVASDASTGTIAYATSNPMTFIKANQSNYDWCSNGSSITDNARWRTSDKDKGIYDPCPVGYRVPDGWDGIWVKAFGTYSGFSSSSNWDDTNKGINFGSTNKTLGSGTIWYPATGFIDIAGTFDLVSYYGYYWSCTSFDDCAYFLNFTYDGVVCPTQYYAIACGHAVRCQKEQ